MLIGEKTKHRILKRHILFALILALLLFAFYFAPIILENKIYVYVVEENKTIDNAKDETSANFLVYSENCMIPKMPVFNDDILKYYDPASYKNCSDNELLSYVTKINKTAKLVIRKEVAHLYTENNLKCCFSYVKRGYNESDPDNAVSYTDCENFENEVTLNESTVLIICRDSFTGNEIYKNIHSFITVEDIKDKKRLKSSNRPMKILLIGIDSISRINLKRMMPLTHNYLERNNWIEYQGYNKIDDNTFPNLMAVFTGRNYTHAYKDCPGTEIGNLDKCNFLWYDFQRYGFVTALVEDLTKISTFNYYRKGFKDPPTDFYFRPYMLASENISNSDSVYCSGPETTGERILNLIKDYSITLKDYPQFGVFWMNSFSHDDINHPAMMDRAFLNFFNDLQSNGVLDDSIVIFFSDHGMRFGDFRHTRSGWYEERLPFIHFWIPTWFRNKYPEKYNNLKSNYNKLTTPYDYYMTLQDLLNLEDDNYKIIQSSGCNNCKSLFETISISRTCEDVAIEQHYCTCTNFKETDKNNSLTLNTVDYMLNELNLMISKSENGSLCSKFKLDRIISASKSMSRDNHETFNTTFMLLEIKTIPEAVFEGTVNMTQLNNNNTLYSISGNISRLDYYGTHAKCIDDSILKKYCYCL